MVAVPACTFTVAAKLLGMKVGRVVGILSMVRFLLLFAFGFLAASSPRTATGIVDAFKSQASGGATSKTRLFAKQNNRPVIVAGSAGSNAAKAALGATLALSAWDLLRDKGRNEASSRSLLPCQPVVALLATSAEDGISDASNAEAELEASLRDSGAVSSTRFVHNTGGKYPSIEHYGDVIGDCSVDPILHVIIEGAAAAQPLLSHNIASQVSFLGIEPIVPEQARQMEMVLPEVAQRCGSMLQEVVDAFGSHECQPSMAMTLDLPLHLSMLQANSLPKSRTAHEDSFLCQDTKNTGDFILVHYQYDYDNPFGGTDPLSCPTREIAISPAGAVASGGGNGSNGDGFASAAAYTALRGNGVPSLSAACIASSVGVVIDEKESLCHDMSTIKRIAKLAEEVKRASVEQPILRKRYIDFGYK